MSRGGDFWSRRRDAVAAEAKAETLADEQMALETLEAEKTDEEICEELGLPDPDSLKAGDDFSAFMGKMVPDRLRRRALRVLWRSNPALANLDALVDYGEDFTDSATVVENLQTTYQVGKGMLTHVLKMAQEAEEQKLAEAEAEAEGDEPAILAEERLAMGDLETMANKDDGLAAQDMSHPSETVDPDNAQDVTPLPPRRMRFVFEDDLRESA